jgi:outer membrane protein TolC
VTDLATLEARVIARHPSLGESVHRERAFLSESRAEGSLPPPEAAIDLWQVPLSKPYAVGDAGMLMLSVRQEIPAPGSLSAGARASEAEARAVVAERTALGRMLVRAADRAFADYLEATARAAVRRSSLALAGDVVVSARRRYAAGGPLADIARAELEQARIDVELGADLGAVQAAAARINVLVARAPDAPLGPPRAAPPATVGVSLAHAEAQALSHNAEAAVAEASRIAAEGRAAAAGVRSRTPSFTVGMSYFHPVGGMPPGWGATGGMSLPWLWGEAGHRADSARESAEASRSARDTVRVRIQGDVAEAWTMTRIAAGRIASLGRDAEPAARRAFEAVQASYAGPSGPELVTVLDAERALFDVELEIIRARGDLDRSLADLDAAVGVRLPRVPIPTTHMAMLGSLP